jgi:hypothetical protein
MGSRLTVAKDPWLTRQRMAGVCAIALVMLAQLGFAGSSSCGWGSLAWAGLACLAPSSLFLISRETYSALVSAVVVFPFLLWANVNECWAVHSGGGAAMAYVVVFLFGVPAALFGGWLTLVVTKLLRR